MVSLECPLTRETDWELRDWVKIRCLGARPYNPEYLKSPVNWLNIHP